MHPLFYGQKTIATLWIALAEVFLNWTQIPLPQPCPASEVLSCSPFPEEQAVGAHRPESPVTVRIQSLQTGSCTIQCKFWSRERFYSCWKYTAKKGKASRILKKKNIIWDEIAGIMNSKGFNECETKTCETKFKNLIRSYVHDLSWS